MIVFLGYNNFYKFCCLSNIPTISFQLPDVQNYDHTTICHIPPYDTGDTTAYTTICPLLIWYWWHHCLYDYLPPPHLILVTPLPIRLFAPSLFDTGDTTAYTTICPLLIWYWWHHCLYDYLPPPHLILVTPLPIQLFSPSLFDTGDTTAYTTICPLPVWYWWHHCLYDYFPPLHSILVTPLPIQLFSPSLFNTGDTTAYTTICPLPVWYWWHHCLYDYLSPSYLTLVLQLWCCNCLYDYLPLTYLILVLWLPIPLFYPPSLFDVGAVTAYSTICPSPHLMLVPPLPIWLFSLPSPTWKHLVTPLVLYYTVSYDCVVVWRTVEASYSQVIERFSRAGPRGKGREWATLGVHPLSWLLSNNRLEEVCGTLTTGTFSSRLLLSNQDKGCTPSVAHSLPLGPALLNLWTVSETMWSSWLGESCGFVRAMSWKLKFLTQEHGGFVPMKSRQYKWCKWFGYQSKDVMFCKPDWVCQHKESSIKFY